MSSKLPPNGASFTLLDDDALKDGTDVPMPDTGSLATALKPAYIQPILFKVDDTYRGKQIVQGNLPFTLNVDSTPGRGDLSTATERANARLSSHFHWDTRAANKEPFWVAYVLGAFQGNNFRDADPDVFHPIGGGRADRIDSNLIREGVRFGETAPHTGGSVVYIEVARDGSQQLGIEPLAWALEQDVLVHEIGHAVTGRGDHPVTGADAEIDANKPTEANPDGSPININTFQAGLSRYVPKYLAALRLVLKPLS